MGKKAATKFAKTVMAPKAKKMRTAAEAVALLPDVGTYYGILTFMNMVDDKAVEKYKIMRPRVVGNNIVTVDLIFPDVTFTFDSYYRVRVDDKYLIGLFHPREWNDVVPSRFKVINPTYLKPKYASYDAEEFYYDYVHKPYGWRLVEQCLRGLEFEHEFYDEDFDYGIEVSVKLGDIDFSPVGLKRKGKATFSIGLIEAYLDIEPELIRHQNYLFLRVQNLRDYEGPGFVNLRLPFAGTWGREVVSLNLKDPLDKIAKVGRDEVIDALLVPALDMIEYEAQALAYDYLID